MSSFHDWLNTFIGAIGPIVLLWRLYSVERSAREAAKGAEDAATLAAGHAAAATKVVAGMAADVKELAVNTNGLHEALVQVSREAGQFEGRLAAADEAAAKENS